MVCYKQAGKQGLYASLPIPSQGHFTIYHGTSQLVVANFFFTLNDIGINTFMLIVFYLVWIESLQQLPRSGTIGSQAYFFASQYPLPNDFPKD